MGDAIKQAAQSAGAARKFSESPPEASRADRKEAAPQGSPAGAATPDPNQLKTEYERTDQQLKAWLWVGAALLLLGFGLWLWGPRERLAETVPVTVRGYTFRQAGSVRGPGGATWLWILADTAGQAQVLLSPDHGRTWRARPLGVPTYRARALALGWGTPGKGLLVGDSGWVRTLSNVFDSPGQGQNRRLTDAPSAALHSVAVDTLGQEAVATQADGKVWASLNQGQTWMPEQLSATRMIAPDSGIIAAYWPRRGSFLLISSQRIGEFQVASKAMTIDMKSWLGLTPARPGSPLVALAFDYNPALEQDHLLFTTSQGQALYAWRMEEAAPTATSHAALRLFGPGVSAVALAFWPAGRPDSALLLSHAPAGDQLLRIGIRPQLVVAEAEARSKLSSSATAAPPVSQPNGRGNSRPATSAERLRTARLAAAATKASSNNRQTVAKTGGAKSSQQKQPDRQEPKQPSTSQPAATPSTNRLPETNNAGGKPGAENNANQAAPIFQQTAPTRPEPTKPDSLNRQARPGRNAKAN